MKMKLIYTYIILSIPATTYGIDIYIRNDTGISYMADINYHHYEVLKDNIGSIQLVSGDDALIISVTSEIRSPIKIIISSLTQINSDTDQSSNIAINCLKDLKRERVFGTEMAIPRVINTLIDIFSSRERIEVDLPIQVYLELIFSQTSNEESMHNKIIYVLLAESGRFKLIRLCDYQNLN